MWSLTVVAQLFIALTTAQTQTGVHTDWPRWCGKVYQPQYPSFNPGGQTVEPKELPGGPALNVQFQPRYNIYLEGEAKGEFVVNAQVSKWFGQPWPSLNDPSKAPPVSFEIKLSSSNSVLASQTVNVGTTGNLVEFSFQGLTPSFDAYQVVLSGSSNISAQSEFFYLPEKTTGSVTKLDNLNGGFLFRNKATNGVFQPLLPYGFYASCDGFLCADNATSQIQAYHDLGLNGMIPLTPVENSRSDFEYMDAIDLKYMYDLREYYKNISAVTEQVTDIKDFEAIYAYWGFDEPDGWQDAFELQEAATQTIHKIDPYHPVAVTLNCKDYYFKEYTANADLIMEDVYPIAINSTFSKWGTVCNSTYGDCGCDDCEGNVQDVSARLDILVQHEEWENLWPKTKVHNPQSFHGENYWFRDPTVQEEVAMNAIAFNHGAKSIMSWVWPAANNLAQIHGKFATVVTNPPVRDFIVTEKVQQVPISGNQYLDAAYWISGNQLLLSVVNAGDNAVAGSVKIPLPANVHPGKVQQVLWGTSTWTVKNGQVQLSNLSGVSTDIVIISI